MRIEGWERRLSAAVAAVAGKPFAWGASDCATFAGDCVLAVAGVDPMAPYRGAYDGPETLKALCEREAGGFVAFVAKALRDAGFTERVAPAFAQRGDVVVARAGRGLTGEAAEGPLLQSDGHLMVGIVMNGWIATRAPVGVRRVPLAPPPLWAWRI